MGSNASTPQIADSHLPAPLHTSSIPLSAQDSLTASLTHSSDESDEDRDSIISAAGKPPLPTKVLAPPSGPTNEDLHRLNSHQSKIVYPATDPYNRSLYVGQLVDGKREGEGTLEWKNGDIYKGGWKNNTFHSYGVLIWSDGMKYFGEWENGQFHGNGTLVWKNGKKYEGRWRNCKHDGMGIMTYGKEDGRNRKSYEGEWENGKRHGFGVMMWNNGASYAGNWIAGKRESYGEHTFPTGERYLGEWKNGKREGKGRRVFSNSDVYEGTWVYDRKDGPGVFVQAHGRRTNQEWEAGRLKPQETTVQEPQTLFVLCVEAIGKSAIANSELEQLPADLRDAVLIFRENEEKGGVFVKTVKDSAIGRLFWRVFSPNDSPKAD